MNTITTPNSIPLATLSIIALCTVIHVIIFVTDSPLTSLSLTPISILYMRPPQLYRCLTATFTHGSWSHLIMNMSSSLYLTRGLESRMGTLATFHLIFLCAFACSFIHVVLAYLPYLVASRTKYILQPSVGYSACLFAYLVLTPPSGSLPSQVPQGLYPYLLLVGIQVILPNISFLGHVSGCVAGELIKAGWLGVPGGSFWRWADASCPDRIAGLQGFLKCPQNFEVLAGDGGGGFGAAARAAWKAIKDLAECIAVVVGLRAGAGRGGGAGQSEETIRRNTAIAAERRAELV